MRRLQPTDAAFLEAFREPRAQAGRSVNTVTVLSRADEIGGGRSDVMGLARTVAEGYERDARLRELTQSVVPVAGLVAQTAATLTDEEFEDLCLLADLVPTVLSSMLLSTDRFGTATGFPLPQERRHALLRRFGLVGLRWATDWLRSHQDADADPVDPTRLARHLDRSSGVAELRDILHTQFTGRRDVVKADSALDLVERAILDLGPAQATAIRSRAERIRLRANGFGERALFDAVHAGGLGVSVDTAAHIERLLGARGGAPASRLDLPEDASPAAVAARAAEEHRHWSGVAADPLAAPDLVRAATVLQRTCELLLTDSETA
jgi:hypothetical protein